MIRRLTAGLAVATAATALFAVPAGAGIPFAAGVSPTTAAVGESFVVTGEGCFDALAGARLERDDVGLGVADVAAPEEDGTFTFELVVIDGITPGPAVVEVACGSEEGPTETLELDVVIDGEVPTTSTSTTSAPSTTATSAAPAAVRATPRFTG
jgi:hypothetical protein